VVRWVAGGGMAWVYEVQERLPGGRIRTWVLKELRADGDAAAQEEARRLFVQEAHILVDLSHPNLPEVSAFFEEAGGHYLVMEFVRGESLARRLEEARAPLLQNQVLDWAIQICDVLAYLHAQPRPVIFRDLKPSNVMVTPEGLVKLIDFGIARTFKRGQERDTVTMGSENYAAPEQWGKAQTDARADLYALGATMYHLLTNSAPLPAYVPAQRPPLRQHNGAVSGQTALVVAQAMQPDREGRFQSANEMREALWDCLPRWERLQAKARQDSLRRRAAASAISGARTSAVATAITPDAAPGKPPAASQHLSSKACPCCQAANRAKARYCRRCGAFLGMAPIVSLALLEPAQAQQESLLQNTITLIGRRGGARPADLDLTSYDPSGYVSRNHATVTSHRGAYHIVDLESANGTFVNEERLSPRQPRLLRPADRIRVGRVVLEFRQR
jgi:serine/threonine protein kinase